MRNCPTIIKQAIPAIVFIFAVMLCSVPAQAVTLYDDNDTKIDLYTRLYLFYANDGEGRIAGNGSRVGLRASHEVNYSLSVFARAEFHYDASQRARGGIDIERDDQGNITDVDPDPVFNDRRNTYVGIKSPFGQLMVGNFDSIYFEAVSHQLDLFEHEGFVALGEDSTASLADSVAYSSPVFSGFQVHGQVRHYEESDTLSGDEELVFQVGATWTINSLTIGMGTVIENEDVGRDESIFGVSAEYQIMDTLSLRLMAEHMKDAGDNDYHAAFGAVYEYGAGGIYASVGQDWGEIGEDGNVERESEVYFSVGANYKFSDPMRVFAEYCHGDTIDEDDVITVGLRYDF